MPLRFETEPPVEAPAPNRMDVACFVGFVRPRAGAASAAVQRWLVENGWLQTPGGVRMPYARASAASLLDVPIPIERWSVFDRLFAWDERAMEGDDTAFATTYLGAAVRSFFAEGGRRCYVVRAGDDWPVPSGASAQTDVERATDRLERLQMLVPGFPAALASSPADRTTWHGVGHLFGLPDVSFVCCPDLPEIVRAGVVPPALDVTPPPPPQQFVECSSGPQASIDDPAHRYRAPRSGEAEYGLWQQVVEIVRNAILSARCETQFVTTLPLPTAGLSIDAMLSTVLARTFLPDYSISSAPRVSSYVQVAFPWVTTRGSFGLPEGLEPADGVLTGVLARNALLRGTFRTAAGLDLASVDDTVPPVSQHDINPRLSLLGPTPRGMQVLTDATASLTDQYQPAGVHRLVSTIVRAARRVGEDATFETSNEQLWAGIRTRVEQVLTVLWRDGAFRGSTPAQAFDVRCDLTTMTQSDLDAGRAIAVVRFAPAAPIDVITVALALNASGVTALATTEAA